MSFGRKANRKPGARRSDWSGRIAAFEALEPRQLLSAAVAQPDWGYFPLPPGGWGGWGDGGGHGGSPPVQVNTTVRGYTPAQIQHAYGFDQITFNNGTIKGDGTGQTIAIVDAYDDPNVLADLKVFDKQFGLADPPSLTKVSQTGSTTLLPQADASWSQEIALDVEWAHAMAPGANIMLVEANSESVRDLMAAVNYARSQPGVSVVSMSWGSDEFRGQTSYDTTLTTPANHTGVTFVASAGDNGSAWGPSWPASSPNVLSVGGTTLRVDSSGNYISESAWGGSGGGVSSVEKIPSYQSGIGTSSMRNAPDVSYDADPNTGFAVYCSVAYQRQSGWSVVGGTSAGTPQWAALVAIANQGRQLAGAAPLNGATQTLPALYTLYTSGGATQGFNDITSGRSSRWNAARSGYDSVSGLGTPRATAVVSALVGANDATGSTARTARVKATVRIKQAKLAHHSVSDSDDNADASVFSATGVSATDALAPGSSPAAATQQWKVSVPAWSPQVQPVSPVSDTDSSAASAIDGHDGTPLLLASASRSPLSGADVHTRIAALIDASAVPAGDVHVTMARNLGSIQFASPALATTSVMTPGPLAKESSAEDLFPLASLNLETAPAVGDGSDLIGQEDHRLLWVLVSAVAVVGAYTYIHRKVQRRRAAASQQESPFCYGFPIK